MPTQQEIDAAKAAKLANDSVQTSKVGVMGASTADSKIATGAVGTTEGAYNPRTKGFETINPNHAVNVGAYSPENKAVIAESYGYDPAKVSQDEFFRNPDGTVGIKLPKITAPKVPAVPAAPVTTSPAAPAPIIPPAPAAPTGTTPPAAPAPAASTVPAQASTVPGVQFSGMPKTGIAAVDDANQKLYDQKQKDLKTAEDSYIVAQGTIQENKGYYSNFDQVNSTFNSLMQERRNLLSTSPDGQITDAQASALAAKYGVDPAAVKNPNRVWDSLMMTDEGKKVLGGGTGAKYDQTIAKYNTDLERNKADIEKNTSIAKQNVDWQIDDVQKQLDRNLSFMTASGAWSGAMKSSGYLAGIENVRNDGKVTIDRLNVMKDRISSASGEDTKRLTENYNKAITEAKAGFDTQLSKIKRATGSATSMAVAQYGVGNEELTKALQTIEDNFHKGTLDTMKSYVDNMRSINQITNDNIDSSLKIQDFTAKTFDSRFNQYFANNGAVLANSSYRSLLADVQAGKLTTDRAEMLKAALVGSVVNTLQKSGSAVDSDDQNTIDHLMERGYTASQVVSAMRKNPKFQYTEQQELKMVDGVAYRQDPETGNLVKIKSIDTESTDVSGAKLNDDGSVILDEQSEIAAKNLGLRTNLLAIPDGTKRGFQTLSDGTQRDLGQCGAFMNDYVGKPSFFGNSYQSKISKKNSDIPTVGSVAIFNTGDGNPGHVGAVVKVDESTGTMWVKSSNLNMEGVITTDPYQIKDAEGFYDPAKTGATSATGATKEPTATQLALINKRLEGKATGPDRATLNKEGWNDDAIDAWSKKKASEVDVNKFAPADIEVYNSMTPTDKAKTKDDPKYRAFQDKKKAVMDNKDSTIDDILEYSRGGKDIAMTQTQSLTKYQDTLAKLEDITKQISTQSTGPIVGRLRSMNPYDPKAQNLKATLQSLIPSLARGVYGEVGVLTDADITNYAKTIPNLNSTEATNKMVLAMTLDTLAGGYKRQLTTLAKAGVDVSGLTSTYTDLKAQAEVARADLGINVDGGTSPQTLSWDEAVGQSK